MKRTFFLILLFGFSIPGPKAHAFDVVNERVSYLESKYITLGIGLGFTGFAQQEGIDGDVGFGLKVSAGHHFNRYLQAEISYQFSTFRFRSPDPVAPTSMLSTRAAMNQEMLRFILTYPAVLAQPYVSVGVGGYNLVSVDDSTAMSYPIDWQIPIAAGIRAYIRKNTISFDAEFGYQFLFGENQDAATLALLGLSEVGFNTYSVMFGFTFHMF